MIDIFKAELIGTFLLILLGNGVVANVVLNKSKGNSSGWIVITSGWGFAVMVAVYLTMGISGGHLNPAVTFGALVTGGINITTAFVYISAQLIGAFLGAVTVYLGYKRHYDETDDEGAILATFSTGPAIRDYKWNFITEMIGTACLTFGASAILAVRNGGGDVVMQAIGPLLIGLLVWSIGLSIGGPTGYAINPARDLGPRIAHFLLPIKNKGKSDWEYSWVPILGPLVGGAIGAIFYALCFS